MLTPPPLPPPDPAFLHMPGSRDPLLMEKLGSANKIRSSELECDLLGKMNNFIFPSIFFLYFLTAVYLNRHTGSIECANSLSLL